MATQFNLHHTIASHENHPYEVEIFKDGELDTGSIGKIQQVGQEVIKTSGQRIPEDCSFAQRIEKVAFRIPADCLLYRINFEFLNTYMDCAKLKVERENLFMGSGSVPTFRLDYQFIRSISAICRFCTIAKERTQKEVAAAIDLLPVVNSVIIEYLYSKSESHLKEEIEKMITIKEWLNQQPFMHRNDPPLIEKSLTRLLLSQGIFLKNKALKQALKDMASLPDK